MRDIFTEGYGEHQYKATSILSHAFNGVPVAQNAAKHNVSTTTVRRYVNKLKGYSNA